MKLITVIKMSLKNIMNNRLRSCLTMLGLIIGIASVIVLVGIGNGASSNVTSQVQTLGTDILTASITTSDLSLTYEQAVNMKSLSGVSKVAPYKTISATVSRTSDASSRLSVIATNDGYIDTTNLKLSSGRRISIIDIENKSKVCVIGSEVATTLFGLADSLGENIKLNGDNYTVIGVLKESGTSMGNNIDNTVLIPFTTAKYLGSDTTINNLYIKVDNEENIDETTNIVSNYIRSILQISSDDYSVSSQTSMLDTLDNINNTLSLLLGGIASISLIVGGIGVMNVMLVAVAERTKEIGIRKSLGAKKKDILIQFLTEALVLCVIGGILGIIIGVSLGYLANNLGHSFTTSASIIILAFSSSAFMGLLFGIFPSYRASCLNPIDALRME